MTRIASIWAQDRGRVLGTGTGMLWHVPADFAHFKRSTMGCPLIMGRRSWEALGGALPGRTNIVLTRSPGYKAEGAVCMPRIEDAVALARRIAAQTEASRIWIAGGAQVYTDTMDLVDELVVTDLDLDVTALHPGEHTVLAPWISPEVWAIDVARSDSQWAPQSGDARWRVTTYLRRRSEEAIQD